MIEPAVGSFVKPLCRWDGENAAKRGLSSVWPMWNTGGFAAMKVAAKPEQRHVAIYFHDARSALPILALACILR